MTEIKPSGYLVNMMNDIKIKKDGQAENVVTVDERNKIKSSIETMQKIGMSEKQIDANLKYIQSELNVTNVVGNYEIKGENNLNKEGATTFKFEIKNKVNGDIRGFCTDYENRASNDTKSGIDPQYGALSKDPKNFLIVDEATGNIRGVYDVTSTDKTTVPTKNSAGVLTSVEGNGEQLPTGMPKNIKDVIKNDFKRYGAGLDKKFPNTEEGAKKFLEALKTIPGNENNKNLTLSNAKELLNYIHNGTNTSGKSNVQELQLLLRGMAGGTGIDISNKNNPKNGDNAYGYATTLQVRALGALIGKSSVNTSVEVSVEDKPKPSILKGNPVFLIDRSGSMENEKSSLSTTIGKFLTHGAESKYRIATYQDHKGNSDLRWAGDGKEMSSSDAKNALNDKSLFNPDKIGMGESGITNAQSALEKLPNNTGKNKENIIMFTDEPDLLVPGLNKETGKLDGKTSVQLAKENLDKTLKSAKDKNYAPIVIFHNDNSKKYVAIDLSKLEADLAKKGKKLEDVLSTKKGPESSIEGTCLDFDKVANILALKWEDNMENLKF